MRGPIPPNEGLPASPRVAVLPDSLVDQIAAGEVVERPASVVKELVENALDAGAKRLRVEVRQGGAALVAVSDDGCGMTPEDARMALRRHATSKLRGPDDLSRIVSFGFRGEALPAIASVSRMRLLTRSRESDEAIEIRLEGGRISGERAAGANVGTRIEVADLFANVPARRKFLKKPGTEWGHVADWLGRLALALPEIHFEVRRDDREALIWPATGRMAERIAAVLSERVASLLVPVEWEESAGHVHAFVSSPEYTRADTNGLYLFVNSRPVRDKLLRNALLASYRDWLPRGRHPSAVLFVTVKPAEVDVNVHPAKWEVRFADPRAIHALVRHAVREAMARRGWLGAVATGAQRSARVVASTGEAYGPVPGGAEGGTRVGERAQGDWLSVEPPDSMRAPVDRAGAEEPEQGRRIRFGALRPIGQLLASYLLLEGENGLLLVDQHAAHERILYEQLRAGWLSSGVERQGLLAPQTVEIDPLGLAALVEDAEVVAGVGFDLEVFGEDAVAVRAIPAPLSGSDPAELVRELAEQLTQRGGARSDDADRTRLLASADRALAGMACHAARRFGDRLELPEQRAILRGLDEIPWAPTCPHGRPVAFALSREEIERRFGRR